MQQKLPQVVHFGREICSDTLQTEQREWWLSNGLGSHAAGTISDTLTQPHHGLLVPPINQIQECALVFSEAETRLVVGNQIWPLFSRNPAGNTVMPQGYPHIESFRLDGGMPVWCHAIGKVRIEKRIWMQPGANTTCIAYRLLPGYTEEEEPRLLIRLAVRLRDDRNFTQKVDPAPSIEASNTELRVSIDDSSNLRFITRCGVMHAEQTWTDQLALQEHKTDQPAQRNHLYVGQVSLPLSENEWVGFAASLEKEPTLYYGEVLEQRQQHDRQLLTTFKIQSAEWLRAPPWIDQLLLTADSLLTGHYLPQTPASIPIISAYPCYGDRLRATMIALPGLDPLHPSIQARPRHSG